TSLQDEDGKSICGINVEDEPLPAFVHQLDPMLLIRADSLPPVFYQGAPAAHPGVTMRLETPVIYFHPSGKGAAPAGRSDVTMRLETPVVYFHQDQPAAAQTIDVKVQFKGGWLTQFYPNAQARINDGLVQGSLENRPLDSTSIGSLKWDKLQLGLQMLGPKTDQHVWLAPRAVDAANITAPWGESEKFLFYRGVGHVD